MPQRVVEHGTFWALDTAESLPPVCLARVEVVFKELDVAEIDDLAAAMNLPSPHLIQQRLAGNRRCFLLWADGQIATYGWVTHGVEFVGELERQFHLHHDEAYVWDCGTVPTQRGNHCYSALLSHIIYQLHAEGTPRIWIGASRLNQHSVRGIANAGFQPVLDVVYRRFLKLTLLWFSEAPTAVPPLTSAAYRILVNNNERRWGRLAIGYKR